MVISCWLLELGTCNYEGLTGCIVLKLLEVVDEHFCKLGGFGCPLCGISVGVAGIKDLGINAGKLGGDCEIEDGELLGGGFQDSAVKDGVNDATGILDGDTLACAVPTGVHEISLGAAFLHALNELFSIFGRMEAEECCAEASRECGGRLGDATLGTGELAGESAQEVIFGLLGCEDAYGRKYSKGIGRKEDYILGGRTTARLNDVLDVVDGVRNACVFGNALVGEVDFAVFVNGYVLKESVASDSVVDVGFAFFVKVDNLCIAATFVVENAVVVPTVFVVTDEETFGVGGKGGFACAGQTEEDGGVFTFLVGVGRAVHGCDAAKRIVVVHDGEHTFLHFAAVPCVDDELHALSEVESNTCLGVDAEFFPVFNFSFGSVENYEIGFEVLELVFGRTDEHVGHEVSLPSSFHHKADSQTGVGVCAAESVNNIEDLIRELFVGDGLEGIPSGGSDGLVVILVFVGCPPDSVFGSVVHHKELVFGGTSGVDTGHHVDSTEVGELTFFIAGEVGVGFVNEQLVVAGIVNHFGTGDAVL